MKKILALLTALTLAAGALVLPALAEESNQAAETNPATETIGSSEGTDQVSSATRQSGKDGRGNRPQKPGRNGQAPDQSSQDAQQQSPAQDNSRNDQNVPQTPGKPGRGGRRQPGKDSQGTLPQVPAQENTNTQPVQAPDQGIQGSGETQPPAGEPGSQPGTDKDEPEKFTIFDELLQAGVISQDVYDAIMTYLQAQTGVLQPAGNSTSSDAT